MNTILSHVFRNLTLIFIDLERKSIFRAECGSKDFRNMYLDHVLSKSRSKCEQVVNIIHDAEKEYTDRKNNTFAWDGVRAATVRAEASRRWFCPYDALPAVAITPPPRQLPSPTVEDYPGPHLDGSPSNPPELPSSSVQFLRFSLSSSPPSPPPPHSLFSLHLSFIFFFFSPVIRHILYPCLLLIRTILPFFIFRRPFIFFSFKFSFKVSWSFDSLCFSFHVSSTLSCFALFTPFTLCLLISAFLFLFPS